MVFVDSSLGHTFLCSRYYLDNSRLVDIPPQTCCLYIVCAEHFLLTLEDVQMLCVFSTIPVYRRQLELSLDVFTKGPFLEVQRGDAA